MDKALKSKLLPFVLAIVVIVLDQITKMLVVRFIPIPEGGFMGFGASFLGDFFQIIHVRNTGVAFSFGADWPEFIRKLLFSVFTFIVLVLVIVAYMRTNEFTKLQRWTIMGIVGGGFGNLIDRVFRPAGVVDFLDVKWFGITGSKIKLLRMERWPTFNVADAAVVVCGIILAVSFICSLVAESKQAKKNKSK
ncbi:MAG: signal peptidase II [Treponema sp.]|nr:signal peptidase II [Treponema sp.]